MRSLYQQLLFCYFALGLITMARFAVSTLSFFFCIPSASAFVVGPPRAASRVPKVPATLGFVYPHPTSRSCPFISFKSTDSDDNDSGVPNDQDFMADFLKTVQSKGLTLDDEDLDDDEDDDELDEEVVKPEATNTVVADADDDDEEDIDVSNIPAGAVNVFLGYDTGGSSVGKLAGNVTLTDDQLYSEVKERVLDTAGGFVEYVKRVQDDVKEGGDDDEEGEDEDDEPERDADLSWAGSTVSSSGKKNKYLPPITVPDPELTAGEVVILVLQALLNNNDPTPNRGVEILFGYSSAGSSIRNEVGLTVPEYAEYLQETEYKVLFQHSGDITIEKGDYSFDGKKGFFTARLVTGPNPVSDTVTVNFILSSAGVSDDSSWLIDSMLIRPPSMRRRRRR
jgi:hypothetical protein